MSGIIKLSFNPFQENTYIVHSDDGSCWIIDPGNSNDAENRRLHETIEAHELNPVALILTHAHLDHILGNRYVHETWGLKPRLHQDEMPVFNFAGQAAQMWGIPYTKGPDPEAFIETGSTLELGDMQFEVRFTPGHSPGEICLVNEKDRYVIAGDVLFQGSIGRTDLPGGNYDTLIASIKNELLTLEDDFTVYSGHGPDTTIGNERAGNPFLR